MNFLIIVFFIFIDFNRNGYKMERRGISVLKRVLLLVVVTLSIAWAEERKLRLIFFGSPTCGECMTVKEELLNSFKESHSDRIEIEIRDITDKQDFYYLDTLETIYGVENPAPIELYFPDTCLIGFEDIMSGGYALIEEYLESPERWYPHKAELDLKGEEASEESSRNEKIKKKFSEFSFIAILAAGLADGINPCAIATMIFLISFLALKKRTRREVLAVGLSFTATVFITYLLLGVGAFNALSMLQKHLWISKLIKWAAIVFAGTVGIISFVDAFRFKKTGSAEDIKLQLPDTVKNMIHKVISSNLSGRRLVFGAVITGFLVTLLEAVCTGQVYLPTIILMTKEQGLKLQGWLYLILYNFLFVLPLLIVMVFAYFGLSWEQLSKTTRKYLTLLKIVLGIVMIALALFLFLSL